MPAEEEIKTKSYLRLPSTNPFTWKNLARFIHSLLDGTFLTKGKFKRSMPFIIMLMILGVFYISNIFKVERTKRTIDDLEEELRELRYEYISTRSRMMYESKPSEIVIKLKDTGIGESMDPPKKISILQEDKTK
jgi:hypothetical protein